MDDEAKKISEMIRSGTYFDEARSWYQAVYIGPVSERTFFLIVAVLSMIIAAAAVISVTSLLPLVDRPALLIKSYGRIDDVIPRLEVLKEPQKTLSSSLMRFYITHYVTSHEGYSALTYESGAGFIRSQSNDDVYNTFSAGYTASNPSSPAAMLGTNGERQITIDNIRMDTSKNPMVAQVKFTADIVGTENDSKTQWTALMQYTYNDLVAENVKNPESGKKELKIQDPQFQVVSYALTQDK